MAKRSVLIGFWFVSTVALLLAFSACQNSQPGQQGEKTTLAPGQEIFLNHCMGCHMGTGDPPGPNDVMRNSSKLASLELFKAYVRKPDNASMPAFSPDQISDADLGLLHQYLKSAQ